MKDINKSILKTVCYFDAINYPLTPLEIFKWLEEKTNVSEIIMALESGDLKKVLAVSRGFYFLPGRADLVGNRLNGYVLADEKFKKAMRMAKIFNLFPWVRAIAIYSSLAYSNSRPDSDIDLFIISSPGRLWSARFFINVYLKVFNLRPNGKNKKNKICVSFLVSEDNINLSLVDELHYSYSHSQFVFLGDENRLRERFFSSNFSIFQSFPNFYPYLLNRRRRIAARFKWLKILLERFFGLIGEKYYYQFQIMILPSRFKALLGLDKRVMLTSKVIKLHDQDKVSRIQESADKKFQEICQAYAI